MHGHIKLSPSPSIPTRSFPVPTSLELLTDIDMLLMFKDGIRGGVATATHRFGRANNKYMGEGHDSSKPSKYIIYLDANNLYGWAMSKPLATYGMDSSG